MPALGTKAAPLGALLLLCLLWASASLRSDLLPGSSSAANSSPLRSQAVPLIVFAVISAAAALAQNRRWPHGRTLALSVLVGIGLFAVPAVLIEVARGHIDASTRVALFSLVPIFAVVLEPFLGSASPSPQRGGLAAGLLAVVGTLLVFPLELPQTTAAAFAFGGIVTAAASVAAANCIAVRIASQPATPSILAFAAIVAGSSALAFGILNFLLDRHSLAVSVFDPWIIPGLVALALLFWLMPRMTAVRMTTRFLIAPLLANLIGLAFLRPRVQGQGWVGLFLITAGSGWLLLGPQDEPAETGPSLGIHQR